MADQPAKEQKETRYSNNRVIRYLQEVGVEGRKVVWPTRDESIRLTGVVIFVTILSMLVIFGIDLVVSRSLRFILEIGS